MLQQLRTFDNTTSNGEPKYVITEDNLLAPFNDKLTNILFH